MVKNPAFLHTFWRALSTKIACLISKLSVPCLQTKRAVF